MSRFNVCECGHGDVHHERGNGRCHCPMSDNEMCSCLGLSLKWYIRDGKKYNKYNEVIF